MERKHHHWSDCRAVSTMFRDHELKLIVRLENAGMSVSSAFSMNLVLSAMGIIGVMM